MADKIAVEGPIASVRVVLRDVERRQDVGEFAEFHIAAAGRRNADSLSASLEDELTSEAQELLKTDEVKVEVVLKLGSLEVVATVIATAKLVAEIGAFLAGVREIRDVFPERIATQVRRRLGRPVAQDSAIVEAERGLLSLKAVASDKPKTEGEAEKFIPLELAAYAGLTLVVLVVVAALVVLGVETMLG